MTPWPKMRIFSALYCWALGTVQDVVGDMCFQPGPIKGLRAHGSEPKKSAHCGVEAYFGHVQSPDKPSRKHTSMNYYRA